MLRSLKHMPIPVEYAAWKILKNFPAQLLYAPAPFNVIIEPTNICNLNCPLCETQNMRRKKGNLDLESFKTIIDDMKGFVSDVAFNFAGEPTINPKLFEMIKYAEDLGIRCMVMTNATLLDRYIDDIFDSRLSTLYMALDGATKESYEKYRRGAQFEQVKRNIEAVCAKKQELNLEKPYLNLQFVVFKHNEHEIPQVTEFAKNVGANALNLKTAGLGGETRKNNAEELKKNADEWLPRDRKFRRRDLGTLQLLEERKGYICQWLLQSVIYWNGDVTTCCMDFQGTHTFGNVFEDGGFKKLWNSKKYREVRKQILNRSLPLCRNCDLPRFAKSYNRVVLDGKPVPFDN